MSFLRTLKISAGTSAAGIATAGTGISTSSKVTTTAAGIAASAKITARAASAVAGGGIITNRWAGRESGIVRWRRITAARVAMSEFVVEPSTGHSAQESTHDSAPKAAALLRRIISRISAGRIIAGRISAAIPLRIHRAPRPAAAEKSADNKNRNADEQRPPDPVQPRAGRRTNRRCAAAAGRLIVILRIGCRCRGARAQIGRECSIDVIHRFSQSLVILFVLEPRNQNVA